MAKRFTAITGGTALALALVFAALQGCGGGSDKTGSAGHNGGGGSTGGGGTTGGTIQQVCEQFCDKLGTCFAVDAGIPIDTVVAGCKSSCSSGAQTSGGAQCTNANAILSAWQACLQGTCDDLETCSYAIPACQGGGAGGSTGGAGSHGAAGNSGGGGSSAGGWGCVEVSGSGCVCNAALSGGTCTGSYGCCYTMGTGASQSCNCVATVSATDCGPTVAAIGATVAAHCPP